MDFSQLNGVDIAILAFIALSMIIAFLRGFVSIMLGFLAWLAAAAVAFYVFHYGRDFAALYISPKELAAPVAVGVSFLLSLILFKFTARAIGGLIKHSPVGFLDRSLGALFGLLRGSLIICLIYLSLVKFMPDRREPPILRQAALYPLLVWGTEMLDALGLYLLGTSPGNEAERYLKQAREAAPSQFLSEQLAKQAGNYKKEERANLDALFNDIAKDIKNMDTSKDVPENDQKP